MLDEEMNGQDFSGEEDNNSELSSAGESSPPQPSEKFVPESRFKEVYGQMKTLEREISSLKEQKQEGTLTEDQQKELQAKTYLKGLLKETLAEQEKEVSTKETQELSEFEEELSGVLSVHSDVKKNDFLVFLEKEGDDYSSLEAAVRGYKRLNETAQQASDKAKRDALKKPSIPFSEGARSGSNENYPDDSKKSLWQIAQEAIRESSKK